MNILYTWKYSIVLDINRKSFQTVVILYKS